MLAENGFLSLTVPEEYGGLGENRITLAMVCETLSRYGCASTAMCYVMHIGAVATIMLRPTPELVDKYIRPLDEKVMIGTLSYSDPETGSHFWYPFSSKAEKSNGGYRVNKKSSWTTLGGFADFYVVQTTSPDFTGYDDLSVFVIDGDDVAAQPSLWDALGLRGNQSGPIEVEDIEIPAEQVVGPLGDGANSNDEAVDPWFLVGSSSVWNGITLGAIDIAKRHTTRKKHVDVGMRVADYPTIQDYIGEAVMDTNACRGLRLLGRRGDGPRHRQQHQGTRSPVRRPAPTTCTGPGRSSSRRPRTSPTTSTRCSTPAAAPATSATWSWSATSATPRPAG